MKDSTPLVLLLCLAFCLPNIAEGQTVTPNLYKLHDGSVNITYSTVPGKAYFLYEGPQQQTIESFGDQIHVVNDPDLGTLVSTTLQTSDSGSTTFILVVPRVNLGGDQSVSMKTIAVIAVRKPGTPSSHGQLDSYTSRSLSGTAEHVTK